MVFHKPVYGEKISSIVYFFIIDVFSCAFVNALFLGGFVLNMVPFSALFLHFPDFSRQHQRDQTHKKVSGNNDKKNYG